MSSSQTQIGVRYINHESHLDALLCALVVGGCILAVSPFSGVPFSDDFSYSRTALDFALTGRLMYNGWAAPLLGWQAVWGALFVKLFGFSFNVLRLSLLPFAMATAYLFHRILIGFGIGRRNAIFGTFSLCLSPLFLLLSTSFMTDVTGLFVVVLCFYMCQRAMFSTGHRAAIAWLVSAALINLAGGTVRQTSWLGALVVVPCTAWFLRRRPNVLAAGIATLVLSLGVVEACMHWANEQPYFQREPIFIHPFGISQIEHAFLQLVRAGLCLDLVLFPLVSAWLPAAKGLNRRTVFGISCLLALLVLALPALHHRGLLGEWLMPWLQPILGNQGMEEPDGLLGAVPGLSHPARLVISILVVAVTTIVGGVIFELSTKSRAPGAATPDMLRAASWLVVPFSLVYLLLLVPRAGTFIIQDRYLLCIMPAGILLLLIAHQHWISAKVSNLGLTMLAVFCAYAIGGAHDFYAEMRSAEAAVQEIRDAGVPRTNISESFPSDAWEQLRISGHMNNPAMVLAESAFDARPQPWKLPPGCTTYIPEQTEPAIQPLYFVTWSETRCLLPSRFPPVRYRAWLPPFHRQDYVRQLPPPDYIP
jgi:hypothetical protein